MRFGRPALHLYGTPIAPGDRLKGWLEIPLRPGGTQIIQACLIERSIKWRNRLDLGIRAELTETPVSTHAARILGKPGNRDKTRFNFDIPIPVFGRPTEIPGRLGRPKRREFGRYYRDWVLRVKLKLRGPNLKLEYEVLVQAARGCHSAQTRYVDGVVETAARVKTAVRRALRMGVEPADVFAHALDRGVYDEILWKLWGEVARQCHTSLHIRLRDVRICGIDATRRRQRSPRASKRRPTRAGRRRPGLRPTPGLLYPQ